MNHESVMVLLNTFVFGVGIGVGIFIGFMLLFATVHITERVWR